MNYLDYRLCRQPSGKTSVFAILLSVLKTDQREHEDMLSLVGLATFIITLPPFPSTRLADFYTVTIFSILT